MAHPFIPTEEVQKLLSGSFEQLSLRVLEAIEAAGERVFETEDVSIKVLGTFADYAIVVSEDAQFAKVGFERSLDGTLTIIGHTLIPVSVLDNAEKVEAFVRSEAGKVVDSYLAGNLQEMETRIRDLSAMVEGSPILADKAWVAAQVEVLTKGRPWEQHFVSVMVEADEFREQTKLVSPCTIKFEKLYDGTISESEHEGYRGLVFKDLASLTAKMDALLTTLEESFAKATSLIDTNSDTASSGPAKVLRDCLSDLRQDLTESRNIAVDAVKKIDSVSALGELFDTLAVDFETQELAGLFFTKKVNDLAADGTK